MGGSGRGERDQLRFEIRSQGKGIEGWPLPQACPVSHPISRPVSVVFASCTAGLTGPLIDHVRALSRGIPIYVVSELPIEGVHWIPYRIDRSFLQNLRRLKATFRGKDIRYAGLLLQPNVPYWSMRMVPMCLWPLRVVAFNENLDHFMLRPACAGTIARHCWWRLRNFMRWRVGQIRTAVRRVRSVNERRRWVAVLNAHAAGWAAAALKALLPAQAHREPETSLRAGISVIVPAGAESGRTLEVVKALKNGLGPDAQVIVAAGKTAAVNRALGEALFSRTCLIDPDLLAQPWSFAELAGAFDRIPDLFAATLQMPVGRDRSIPDIFGIQTRIPQPGEDLSYVLNGNPGATMFDTSKLRALGGLNEVYESEELRYRDLGYRAWLRGWPTVFAAAVPLAPAPAATISPPGRDRLRFVARAPASPQVFLLLWKSTVCELAGQDRGSDGWHDLKGAWRIALSVSRPPKDARNEESFLRLTGGAVTVFPGRRTSPDRLL